MIVLCLLLVPLAAAVSLPATWGMIRLSRRLGMLDTAAMPGQIKDARRPIANTGGVGIAAGLLLPMVAGLAVLAALAPPLPPPLAPLEPHLPGIREQFPLALGFIASALALHVLGLVDDRRPLGPFIKLAVMLVPPLLLAVFTDTRLLTAADPYAGGTWLSVLVTVLWFGLVTNALNFLDNMDGLAGGVAAIASACLLAASLVNGQWFVAATLALLLGACLGFLCWNFPPAKVFMGDGGSLILGFALAFLTTRITYFADPSDPAHPAGPPIPPPSTPFAVFMPLVVLAIPLYDFLSVTAIRLSQKRSPFVGDLQHFSHRLVKRGLSKRAAVLVIYGFTLVTGISGIALRSLEDWQAVLVGVQTAAILGVLAAFEFASSPARRTEPRP